MDILKNYSPYRPATQQTTSEGFFNGGSYSRSRSPKDGGKQKRAAKGFIEQTYKIVPTKIPVLEKIFDKVYAEKRNVAIQCEQEPNAFTVDYDGVIGMNESQNLQGTVETSKFHNTHMLRGNQTHRKLKTASKYSTQRFTSSKGERKTGLS